MLLPPCLPLARVLVRLRPHAVAGRAGRDGRDRRRGAQLGARPPWSGASHQAGDEAGHAGARSRRCTRPHRMQVLLDAARHLPRAAAPSCLEASSPRPRARRRRRRAARACGPRSERLVLSCGRSSEVYSTRQSVFGAPFPSAGAPAQVPLSRSFSPSTRPCPQSRRWHRRSASASLARCNRAAPAGGHRSA